MKEASVHCAHTVIKGVAELVPNPRNPNNHPQPQLELLAKIILASSNEGDTVLDPFAGSGTTSVVAKKLGRNFVGIELNEFYCCLIEKRLANADSDRSIQGYSEGVFWERNSADIPRQSSRKNLVKSSNPRQPVMDFST